MSEKLKEIYLAGGCFWGIEKYLQDIYGIKFTQVAYANGNTKTPTYDEVSYNDTGHAETVYVKYNPMEIKLEDILELYFDVVNPTVINRQGNDLGSQYRTGIYYTNSEDEKIIQTSINKLQEKYDKPIVIEVKPLIVFYKAEEYHQKYIDKNPNGYCHISKEKINNAKAKLINKG